MDSVAVLVVVFCASAALIWLAGIWLSKATDSLDGRLGLGAALGGLILLSIATDLPELAITVSAAVSDNLELAVGNLIGGVAMQTLVLVALDAAYRDRPITHSVGSLIVVLEASIVIGVLVVALMATQLPEDTHLAGVSPGTFAIVLIWLGGLFLVSRARRGIPWEVRAPDANPGRSTMHRAAGKGHQPFRGRPTWQVALVFAAAALMTLGAGVAIEESGARLAGHLGLQGAVFGATILAAATALPELSTGMASIKLGDNELAFSDIFGGNAFLPVLFLLADLVAGHPALPAAAATDLWMAGLGIVMTLVFMTGLLLRPQRQYAGRLGIDSLVAVGTYALGIAGLVVLS